MSEHDFDHALIAAAFRLAAASGWPRVTILDAAISAGLSPAEARLRFPTKRTLLHRFGALMDHRALAEASREGPVRDQLFDLLMSRFDVMKPHREGTRALLRALPFDPLTALDLACATRLSMRWMLTAAGVSPFGPCGELRLKGLIAVWLWALRAFEQDSTEDLSHTMAALDKALERAERAASRGRPRTPETDEPAAEPDETASPA